MKAIVRVSGVMAITAVGKIFCLLGYRRVKQIDRTLLARDGRIPPKYSPHIFWDRDLHSGCDVVEEWMLPARVKHGGN